MTKLHVHVELAFKGNITLVILISGSTSLTLHPSITVKKNLLEIGRTASCDPFTATARPLEGKTLREQWPVREVAKWQPNWLCTFIGNDKIGCAYKYCQPFREHVDERRFIDASKPFRLELE